MSEADDLSTTRTELHIELGLLHDRINALLAAEAFLTIAYTAAMGNGTPWGAHFAAIVGPVLAVLGLMLALLAWPGVRATTRLVSRLTEQQAALMPPDDQPVVLSVGWRRPVEGALQSDQRRSLLFFRAVPVTFIVVWIILFVVAVALTWW